MGKVVAECEREKRKKYRGVVGGVVPLALSSGGCMGAAFRSFLYDMCRQSDPDDKDIGGSKEVVQITVGPFVCDPDQCHGALGIQQVPSAREI